MPVTWSITCYDWRPRSASRSWWPARRPRGPRASRRGRCQLVGTSPDRSRPRAGAFWTTPTPTVDGGGPQSLRRRARRPANRRGTGPSPSGGEPPEQFGSGYERRVVLIAAGYQGGLNPAACRPGAGARPRRDRARGPGGRASCGQAEPSIRGASGGLDGPLHDRPRRDLAMFAWTFVLFVRSRTSRRRRTRGLPPTGAGIHLGFHRARAQRGVDDPRQPQRLLEIDLPHRLVVVVDDGSEDRTPDILRQTRTSRPSRDPPRPPQRPAGKAAALNHGYRALDPLLEVRPYRVSLSWSTPTAAATPSAPGTPPPTSPPTRRRRRPVAGADLQPRGFLTWMQDVEFSVYGCLFQAGPHRLGHCRHGRQRSVQPPAGARRRGRSRGPLARPPHRGPGPRPAADRRRLGRPPGPSRPGGPAGPAGAAARCSGSARAGPRETSRRWGWSVAVAGPRSR